MYRNDFKMIFSAACFFMCSCTNTLTAYSQNPMQLSFSSKELTEQIMIGNYAEAEKMLQESDSENITGRFWLMLKQQKQADALSYLEENIARSSLEKRKELIITGIAILNDTKYYDESENLTSKYQSILEDQQSNQSIYAMLLFLERCKKDNNINGARKITDRILEDGGKSFPEYESINAVYGFAMYLYSHKMAPESLNYLEELMAVFPETSLDPGYQHQWATVAISADRSLEALVKFDEIQTDYPDYYKKNSASIHIGRGLAYKELKDYEESFKEHLKASELIASNKKDFGHLKPLADSGILFYNQRQEFLKEIENAQRQQQQTEFQVESPPNSSRIRFFVAISGFVLIALIFLYRRKNELHT